MSQAQDDRLRPTSVSLRRVIDSLDDGVVVSDLEGRCLLSNPAARRLFATDFADVPAAEWTSAFGCLLPDM
jgi:PAS domain-containing protein